MADSSSDDISDSELYRVNERTIGFVSIPGAANEEITEKSILFHGGNLLLLFGSICLIILLSVTLSFIFLAPIPNRTTTTTTTIHL